MSCNCKNDSCPIIGSGDCDGIRKLINVKVDDHITSASNLDECSPSFCNDLLQWCINQAKNTSCVLKNLANQICSLWNDIKDLKTSIICIDKKTRFSTQVHDIWSGSANVFDLPTMNVTMPLSNFDHLDIHCYFGTERVVLRLTIARGRTGGTIVSTDRVAGNSGYDVADGAMIFKELGLDLPTDTSIKIHHFHWSVLGHTTFSAGTMEPAYYLQLANNEMTEDYANTQDVVTDRPHTIVLIQGIISRETDTCYVDTPYEDTLC